MLHHLLSRLTAAKRRQPAGLSTGAAIDRQSPGYSGTPQVTATPQVAATLRGVSKMYRSADTETVALQPTTLSVRKGELMLIAGPSGSGKTTLLSLLGCIIYPTAGSVFIDTIEASALTERALSTLRLQRIGFVFQSFNLIAPLTVEENVSLPLELLGVPRRERKERIASALALVGMSDRATYLPKQLSGGQQQRAAIARALVTEPDLILCDEPTAALDSKSSETVMQELRALAERGKAVAIVTHDLRLQSYAHRIVRVSDGTASEAELISQTLSASAVQTVDLMRHY